MFWNSGALKHCPQQRHPVWVPQSSLPEVSHGLVSCLLSSPGAVLGENRHGGQRFTMRDLKGDIARKEGRSGNNFCRGQHNLQALPRTYVEGDLKGLKCWGQAPGKEYISAGDPLVPGAFGSAKKEQEEQEKKSPPEIFSLPLKPSCSPRSSSIEICLSRHLPGMFCPLRSRREIPVHSWRPRPG